MQYKQPSFFNAVSISLMLLALAGGYWLWRFFPAYWDGWTVDHELTEAAATVYSIGPEHTEDLAKLVEHTKEKIVTLGITDPDLKVNLNIKGTEVLFTADYSVIITHPGIDKKTKITLHRTGTSNIKRVDW